MKKPVQQFGKLILLVAFGCMIFASCSKDDTPDIKKQDPDPKEQGETDPEDPEEPVILDANKITQSLKFRNGTVIKGDLPTGKSAKIAMVDLKIDTDTIFWVEGVTNRIKIRKPDAPVILVGSFWAQVEGSDSYIEAEFEKEQENDTIVILNFDFDVTEWDPPFSFNIQIVPINDADGTPLDVFDLPVAIEEPIVNLNASVEDFWQGYWHWMETTLNDVHHTGPYENIKQAATAGLCCDGSGGVWNCFSGNPDYEEMDYTIDYFVVREFLYFSDISDVRGELREFSNNLDWEHSNICENEPAYITRTVHNPYKGSFTEIDNTTRTISNLQGSEEEIFLEGVSLGSVPLPIYAGSGSFVVYKLLSKHYLKEIRSNPEGGPGSDDGKGAGLERLYYKRFVDPDAEYEVTIWFDVCGVCI